MTALVLALAAGFGAFYLYTALALRWRGVGLGPRVTVRQRERRDPIAEWMAQAGLGDVALSEFGGVVAALFVGGALFGFVLFGGVLPALVMGTFTGTLPLAGYRHRRIVLRQKAQEAWPRIIEEIRILTASAGRSIPQALFEAGRHAPGELRPAFDAAQREWLLSTDFPRTLDVLRFRLADPTADATCETLLIAHELGGTELDARLASLAEDRRLDTRDRKDARAKQAGARFARWFVLIVPFGMAVVGLSLGNGKDAYASTFGQLAVVAALLMMVACWIWATTIMRLPDQERVFDR